MGCHSTAVLTAKQVNQAAKALYDAELSNEPTTPTSEKFPDADIEDAYRISQAVTELKLKARTHDQGPQDRAHVEGDAGDHGTRPSPTTARCSTTGSSPRGAPFRAAG